jgi:hypothetical protein
MTAPANPVTLVNGLFQDTLGGDEPIALAHIDGDWYLSVRTVSCESARDCHARRDGRRKAVDEFLAKHPDEYRTVRRTSCISRSSGEPRPGQPGPRLHSK